MSARKRILENPNTIDKYFEQPGDKSDKEAEIMDSSGDKMDTQSMSEVPAGHIDKSIPEALGVESAKSMMDHVDKKRRTNSNGDQIRDLRKKMSHTRQKLKEEHGRAYFKYPARLFYRDKQTQKEVEYKKEHTINTQQNNEEAMRNVFIAARNVAREEVDDLLADFRHTRARGPGSIFGDQYLTNEDMPKSQELKIVESTLLPHLDRLTSSEVEKEPKNQALAASLNTFMKQAGVKNQTGSALERAPSFINKDRRGPLKFPHSTKKQSVKGHVFQKNQYLNTTFCNQCHGLLWGIGYQGLQCTHCEFNVHKQGPCLEQITSECPGKKKKRDKEHRKTKSNFPANIAIGQGKDDSKAIPTPLSSPITNVIHMQGDNEELSK
eukprot:XP_011683274.1 PREDICTED: serine/threonine-protein kinase mrck-1 [Strongylocentrotus purpuratus]